MKRLLVLVAGLAAIASLNAQTTGIAGTVIDAQTREPIPGVTVCCYFANAQTDSLGRYLISGIEPGRYRVRAIKTGYETAYYPESVEVVHGVVTDHIDFALTRTASQPGRVTGRVVSSANGQVIVHAEVRASGPHGSRAVVQAPGGYEIESLPAGRYRVSASATGFEPGAYPESATVTAGQTTPNINFHLVPTGGQTGGISGWVFDATTRQPIVGATVCTGVRSALTNEQGYYVVEGLEAGRYRVRAMAAGYVTAYYPESVAVVAGQVTPDINFHLEPAGQQYGSVAGRVTSTVSGQLILGATVRATNAHVSRCVTQCSTGYRLLELPPGKYWISAAHHEFQPGSYPESVEVVAGQATEGIDFRLEPLAQGFGGISGFVTNARTLEPVVGARVVAEGPVRGTANTCQRGGYVIRELSPGVYVAQAMARGFQPSAIETVEVVAGRITPDVNFLLEPLAGDCGFIAGWVRDSLTNTGINDATVFAWGEAGQGQTYSESCGGYLIRELRPGAYTVRAARHGYYHKLFPEMVHVAAGETTYNVNFLLSPVQGLVGGVSGFVFDGLEQLEVGGASVLVIGETGSWEATAGSRGDFLVDGLEPGDYQLEVQASGYTGSAYPDAVTVEAGSIAGFINPAVYPLTGVAEPAAPAPRARVAATPNPFSLSARIEFSPLLRAAAVVVYDRTGRTVRRLAVEPGASSVTWDGRDAAGAKVAEGIYFCRPDAPGAAEGKLVLLDR
jgi:hypothetical protein